MESQDEFQVARGDMEDEEIVRLTEEKTTGEDWKSALKILSATFAPFYKVLHEDENDAQTPHAECTDLSDAFIS